MDKPMIQERGMPLYHWAEWPLAILMALLLTWGLWYGPGSERHVFVRAFEAVSVALFVWSTYLEWRQGVLCRSFTGLREGIQNREQRFVWVHSRLPLRLAWLVMVVLGWLHF